MVVETERGTDRVPLSQVETALEVLGRDGEVGITPEAFPDFAFRSSFVGAVLAELEGQSSVGSSSMAQMAYSCGEPPGSAPTHAARSRVTAHGVLANAMCPGWVRTDTAAPARRAQ